MKGVTINKIINERCLERITWLVGLVVTVGIIIGGFYYVLATAAWDWFKIAAMCIGAAGSIYYNVLGYRDMTSFVQYHDVQVDDTVNLNEFSKQYEIITDYGDGHYKVRPYYLDD